MIKDESQRKPTLVRREVWTYPAKKAAIVFLNGKYTLSKDIEPLERNLTKSVALSPDQINEALSVDQLSTLIGSKPQSSVGMPGQLMRDTT